MGTRADAVAATRERIAREAMALFLEHAYEDVTLAAIAKAAGVSHQTVLNHFESKDGVVLAVAELLATETQSAPLRRRARRRGRRRAGAGGRLRAHRRRQLPLGGVRAPARSWPSSSTRPGGATRTGSSPCSATACPPTPAARRRAVHALHAATDVYSWKLLRRDLRPEPHRDREDHGRPRGRHPGRNHPMTGPPRTYLFALVDGGGTVPPELGTVRRLVERGHRVTVLAEDSMARRGHRHRRHLPALDGGPQPAQPPPRARPLPRLGVQDPDPAVRPAARHSSSSARPPPTPPTCSPPWPTSAPTWWCARSSPSAPWSAPRRPACPSTCCSPTRTCSRRRACRPFGLGLQPATGALGRLRDRALNALHRPPVGQGPAPPQRAAGRPRPRARWTASSTRSIGARRVLVLTSADFDFPAELPANVRYVGPVLDDPAWAATPWTAPPGDDPLVLVALSSTFQDHAGCLQRIVDALGTLPGARPRHHRARPSTRPTSPPPPTCRSSPPRRTPRCCRSAAAVVTHGGHGTVVRALAADVPLVVLHHGRDQADNAARVTARGAGLAVKRGGVARRHRHGRATAARRPVVPHRRRPPRSLDPPRRRQRRPGGRARGPPSGGPRTGGLERRSLTSEFGRAVARRDGFGYAQTWPSARAGRPVAIACCGVVEADDRPGFACAAASHALDPVIAVLEDQSPVAV